MSVQEQPLRLVGEGPPEDFGKRLERFMKASDLGPRPLARLVGVSPHRVREWRRGVVPSGHYIFLLLAIAEDKGLRGILMPADRGKPPGTEVRPADHTRRRFSHSEPGA